MKLTQYQVDAFASRIFGGNPAAVVPLSEWLADDLLQAIAEENNLSETAFYVPITSGFELRWFTPVAEVDLCGHATLATAHVLFQHEGFSDHAISFHTRSGELWVCRVGESYEMNFPATEPIACHTPELLTQALGAQPLEVLTADDYIAVFDSEASITALKPNMALLSQLDLRGVMVTAPGLTTDFVSRFFAPKLGIPEDPVTGSAHCVLAPYWGKRLGLTRMTAFQCSRRGGEVGCRLEVGRVYLTGRAVTFMQATIWVPH
jgi:PhzF family phenazine biosynthesis protein